MNTPDDDIQNDPLGEQFDLSCIENLSSILAQVPDQEPPVIKREARYLSGNDMGKKISFADVEGALDALYFIDHLVHIRLAESGWCTITPTALVTIIGKGQSK